jgi:formate dehydrogenase assembly factor FdhD
MSAQITVKNTCSKEASTIYGAMSCSLCENSQAFLADLMKNNHPGAAKINGHLGDIFDILDKIGDEIATVTTK